MPNLSYSPPGFLKNGTVMTVYTALRMRSSWENTISLPEPPYQETIFTGANDVPIFGLVAIPETPRGTIVATYGITGTLDNQFYLKLLGRKAYSRGYAVVLFDWRAHGKTGLLSPTLTSDGLYEGDDFVCIAAKAKAMGCPAKFWLAGFSLGGQLALWAGKSARALPQQAREMGLEEKDIGGITVICPSIDSNRSLNYLERHPISRYLERAIAKGLKKLACELSNAHPGVFDKEAIARANSIRNFDRELVISRLGFPSVEAYYDATSPIYFLPNLDTRTLIIYAEDDPLFAPSIVPELKAICRDNDAIELRSTRYGGHVGYISSKKCQQQANDPDIWWAWNRALEWIERQ
ncbi:MAG: alpha/beta fold hydrolase [Okeania sp. SIO2H7]|nr:alpha/beta fold hydrolase [Okeania sp. SIO2H7]